MTLHQINRLDRADFVTLLGGIFEHSPWIVERAFDARPFASIDALYAAMTDVMYAAGKYEQLTLLQMHPDLAGKAALRGELTESSRREQVGAGLDRCTPAELASISQLNLEYRAKFGFPFILAVKGYTREQVIERLASRLKRTAEEERREALDQVARIARLRLSAAVCE
jgi:2-oxo-4-hydroxy-4-carboxy-5-ureidoimidazoline decarboxylase